MKQEDLKLKLQAIAAAGFGELTAETRKIIREACKDLGVTLKNTRCKDCYIDAAIACYKKITEQQAEQQTEQAAETEERAYKLKDGIDVIFLGRRINNVTLTDQLARYIIAHGFPKYYFAKREQ